MKTSWIAFLALVPFSSLLSEAAAGDELARRHSATDECSTDRVAFGGYDIVSYRMPEGPLAGKSEHRLELDGTAYLFASAENLERFQSDPHTYLPRYGGWCAVSLALGSLRCPDYANFKLENGALLFFEVTGFTNGRAVWDADPARYRSLADENFRRLTTR